MTNCPSCNDVLMPGATKCKCGWSDKKDRAEKARAQLKKIMDKLKEGDK